MSVILALLLVTAAGAGEYRVPTTADQDAALAWRLERENVARSRAGASALPSIEAYVQALVGSALRALETEYREGQRAQCAGAYAKLSEPERAALRTQLGGVAPCR